MPTPAIGTPIRPSDLTAGTEVQVTYLDTTVSEVAFFDHENDGLYVFVRTDESPFVARWGLGIWFLDPSCQTIEIVQG